jgi:outer membrane protein TolC
VRRACQLVLWSLPALLVLAPANAQLSLYTTIDTALRNSPQVRMSAADVQRAQAGVAESVGVYKPSYLLGSSLGWTYGFPLGQPEVFSLTAQSLAFSFSQPDYIRSARRALESAQLQLKDTRQQVILDTALDYIELAKVEQQIAALDQENGYVQKLIEIEDQRVDAGYDRKIELTEARLTGAQVGLKRIHLANQADLLRARLAHLTGLSPADMTPQPQTIPPVESPARDGNFDSATANANSGVQAAYAAAKSKLYAAFGDARQNNRPTVAFVASYGLFSNFNNYAQYYLHFQENNFGAGIQINFPFFDASRKAKARGSRADAVHAEAQADLLHDQTSEQALQLQKSLSELAAQEQVAEIQNELAQDQLQAVRAQLQSSGGGNSQAAPLTPKDEQRALLNERRQYVDMLDARFQLTQAQLSLLRTMGDIETWAKAVPVPHP